MWKRKLLIQTAVCIVIALAYTAIMHSDNEIVKQKVDQVTSSVSVHYTISDIAEKSKTAVIGIIKAPAVITTKIISSNETYKYGVPIDPVPTGETGPVYAVSGGKVIRTGKNKDMGLYIVIAHEGSESTYGNCDRLYAEENEHVRKGQIIASFTNDGTKEFYYQMNDNL